MRAQLEQLRTWNRANLPQRVVAAFESGEVASSEATLGEYVKALAKMDRLDSSALMRTLQVGGSCWNL